MVPALEVDSLVIPTKVTTCKSMESIETTTDMVQARDLLDVFQKSQRKGEFSRLKAWRSKKNSSSEEKKIHQPVQNSIYMDSKCSDDNSNIKEDSKYENEHNTKVAKDISVLEENKNETEKSSTSKTKENIVSDSEEEWTPPEFINCVKFYMDEFQDTEAAEAMIRNIFDDNNILIKQLQILYNSHNKFRKLIGV